MAGKKDVPKFDDTEPAFEDTAPAFDDTDDLSDNDKDVLSKYVSQPEVPLLESARAGYAHGGSFGLSPRIGGVMGALMEAPSETRKGIKQALETKPEDYIEKNFEDSKRNAANAPKSLEQLYDEYKKYNEQREAKAKAGNPITYGASEFAGAIASPLNKIGAVGELGAEAPIVAKMGRSALAGARMGTVAGATQSKDLTDIPQTIQNAGEGAAMGGALGLAVPPVGAALKGGANMLGGAARKIIGKPGPMFSKGMEAGMEGAPNLAGEPGQLSAVQDRNNFSKQFVEDLHGILASNAKNKNELIAGALQKSQLAPKEAVAAVMEEYLNANPQLNEETARKELAHMKNIIRDAVEGEEKTETVRHYHENAQPSPLPSQQPIMPPPAPRDVQGLPPEPMAQPPQGLPMPPQAQLGVPPQGNMSAVPEGTPPPETPPGFDGYEAIHKATVDPTDEEAIAAFHHKVEEKLADERALGSNVNDNDVQFDQVKIPGSDKVRLVAKRAKVVNDQEAFKEQASNLVKQQREDQRLQAMLDKQNEEKLKMQSQQDAEMSKPQFTDVQQTVRTGDRNIQDPKELYNLYDLLKQKSKINPNNPGASFSTKTMQKMAGNAAQDIASIIKDTIPETQTIDSNLTAANNVSSRLGMRKNLQNMTSADHGTAETAQEAASKKITGMMNPDPATNKSVLDQNKIDFVKQELNKINPKLGEVFDEQMSKHSENASTMAELNNPKTVGGGGPILNATRKMSGNAAYNMGHAAGNEIKKMQPGIEAGKKIFQNYTPDVLQKAGAAASQSTNQTVQKMGQVLSKLATADDRTRNSMMFVLQQQAGYREMMAPYFPEADHGTPQAKDKSLEKYK